MPVQYKGVKAEHLAVRNHAGVFDVSHMGELFVGGKGAVPAVNRLITNDLAKAKDGQAVYTCCCNEHGQILDDLIIYRLSEQEVLVVCNASNRAKIAAHFRNLLPANVSLEDRSDALSLIAFQGPRAIASLQDVLGATSGIAELPSLHIAEFELLGERCRIGRTGYTGEDGVEIFCDNAIAPSVFSTLLAAGGADAQPAGLAARDTLRLEAKLALYGNDIDEATNPLEASLAWTVKFDKPDFVGREALLRVKEAGIQRKLVGFEMTGRGIARSGYPLLDQEKNTVGRCTSGAPGPTVNKNIGLGYLPIAMSALGTEFLVDCRGKTITARVTKTPFYRRPRPDR